MWHMGRAGSKTQISNLICLEPIKENPNYKMHSSLYCNSLLLRLRSNSSWTHLFSSRSVMGQISLAMRRGNLDKLQFRAVFPCLIPSHIPGTMQNVSRKRKSHIVSRACFPCNWSQSLVGNRVVGTVSEASMRVDVLVPSLARRTSTVKITNISPQRQRSSIDLSKHDIAWAQGLRE